MPKANISPLDVLKELQKSSPNVARIVYIALGVVIAGSFAAQNEVEYTEIPRLAGYMAAAAALLFVTSKFHGLISVVLAWFVVVISMIWVVAFVVQTLSTDARTGEGIFPLRAGCFFPPWQIGCPAEAPKESRYAETRKKGAELEPVTGRAKNTVYVQFAGSLRREAVVQFAEELASNGWNVQGASRGGERTSAAYGLNEVRYFHPDDKDLAEELSKDFSSHAPWVRSTKSSDFSNAEYNVPQGYLEIWTSVR